jgi:hypothetical protein
MYNFQLGEKIKIFWLLLESGTFWLKKGTPEQGTNIFLTLSLLGLLADFRSLP